MENFKLLKIEDSLKNSLNKMNFTKPTPIQGYGDTSRVRRAKIYLEQHKQAQEKH
jgi:superfamily II DNA/RNA helicase